MRSAHPFPAGLKDALDVVRALDGPLVVAGDSAGGNLAAVVALKVPVALQLLIYPVTDAGLNTPSYREFDGDFGLTAASMRRFFKLYLNGSSGLDPDVSPLRAELQDAPPAYIVTASHDVLRDDGDVIVVYSYIHMPVVADRDVITRAELSRDPATGIHRMRWRVSDEGPPPRPGVVRLTDSSGAWEFSPVADGRTQVVYENHTDIGGSIPAWIVEPMMDDTVVQNFVRLRERVERERRMSDAAPDGEPSS